MNQSAYPQPETAKKGTVAIVGVGFADTALVRVLERNLSSDWQLLLVSEESYTTLNPMLAEVVGAGVFPEHVIAPVREMIQRAQFIMGRVQLIDPEKRMLRCETLAGLQDIVYDHRVLAFGQRANMHVIPGMAEHALPLKLVGDALFTRNCILQRLACIELTPHSTERRCVGHFVVVGGGFSGVEVAGTMADFMRSAQRFYPRIVDGDAVVTLLHDGERLLPELLAGLGDAAAASLRERGVTVTLNTRAARVDARSVTLAEGTLLAADTVVCPIGARSNPHVETLGAPLLRGRIASGADGMIAGRPRLWALGDCAAVPNGSTGAICQPTTQLAVAQARQLAANLFVHLEGLPTKPFQYQSRGMMATNAHLKGVAEVAGIRRSGLLAWMAWRADYLMLMPTLGSKLHIFVQWTWAMFFPLDITHLRFTLTSDVDTPLEVKIPPPSPSSPLASPLTSL